MKDSRGFYKQNHEDNRKLFQNVENEKKAMSAEERRMDEEQAKLEFQRILARIKETEKHTRYIRIPFRRQLFIRLVRMALIYAEEAGADITYEITAEHGFLRFEMEQIILDDMRPYDWNVWRYLIRHANTFCVSTIEKYGDPALQFTFYIKFRKWI